MRKIVFFLLVLALVLSLVVPVTAAQKGKYDNVGDFHEGLAMVAKGYKYGFIDKTGKEIVKSKYDIAYSFRKGLLRLKKMVNGALSTKQEKSFYLCKAKNNRQIISLLFIPVITVNLTLFNKKN